MLRAVLFDVDFTLSRPGPELGPDAYRSVGAAHGLALDPDRYEDARLAAFEDLRAHPELVHDEEIWVDVHRGHRPRHGRRRPRRPCVRRRDRPALGGPRELRPLRRRRSRPRGAPRPRPSARPDLERAARPRGVRPPPPTRRRRRGGLEEPRADEAARVDLRERAGGLGVGCGGGRHGRRLLRGRHRGRPGARHAGDPARPRRALSGRAGPHHRPARPPGRARAHPGA